MADPTPDRLPPATPFCILLGSAGLLASGFGLLPGAPAWVWLAVLVTGALLPYLRERSADAKARTDDLRTARDASDNARMVLRHHVDAWEKRLDGVITPEESRRLRADFNAMLLDFAKLRGEVETVAKEQRMREMGDTFGPEIS
jgi:hypothetical protein